MKTKQGTLIERLRSICLALPGASEKLSHGEPTWFVADRVFAMFDDHHHGAEHVSVWCNVPEGAQRSLVDAEPEHFFVPPYVGKAGWVGVRLDTGLAWPAVSAIIAESHAATIARSRRAKSARRKRPRA